MQGYSRLEREAYRAHVRYGGVSNQEEFFAGIFKRKCGKCDQVFIFGHKQKTCECCKRKFKAANKARWSVSSRRKGDLSAEQIIANSRFKKFRPKADKIASGHLPKDRPEVCRGVIYSILGQPWRSPGISDSEAYRLRYQNDNSYAIAERLRRQMRKAKKRDGISEVIRSAIRRHGSSRAVEDRIGYTIDDLMRHIEASFSEGMDWRAFRSGEIHIDHVMPQSYFDTSCDEQWRACWALSNLRPMWARDNLAKSDRLPCGGRGRRNGKA
ncbi:HNH endonuclease [Xanthomonas phage FoX1]|uniref:HNH endonuclease n=1 Tax=Xanthomonas phage FoX1 TaxID=2723897 RepID=A0A858NMR7_9CAUD|nr:HNH endonuclease [Xanthomonas phage FoX1]QJB21819.1 HNH endonuclease [Xanthomonas phage FoX1]